MAEGGLFKWSVGEMVHSIRPGGRYLLMLLYALMGVIFFIAVIAYGALNAAPLLSASSSVFVGPIQNTATNPIDYPAITVCPTDVVSIIALLGCTLQEGHAAVADCSGTTRRITVTILGEDYPCIQYNGESAPVQATSLANSLLLQTSINTSNTAVGDPMGAFVIIHAQGTTPILGDSSFVATPGYMQLVLLHNNTYIGLNGTTVAFTTGVSKAPLKGYSADQGQTFSLQVAYPQLVSYVQREIPGSVFNLNRGRFITEAGGLAALLLFLHRFVMWVTALPLFVCCKAHESTRVL